jgi:acyl-CoA synthetase (AMP-forming)/AMP-acid ligase II
MLIQPALKIAKEKFARQAAIVFQEESLNYVELYEKVNRLGNALLALGVKKQDKVAIILPNCLEYAISYLGIFNIGAIAVLVDSFATEEEIIRLLKHAEADYLITATYLKNFSLANLRAALASIKKIILCGAPEPGCALFAELLAKAPATVPPIEVKEEDYCAIFYTSGTTGVPKGVLWRFRQLDNAPKMLEYFLKVNEKDTFLCPIPFSHSGGLVFLQGCFCLGVKLVLMSRFIPLEALKLLSEHKITIVPFVPPMLGAMLQVKEFSQFDLSSLRYLVVFGASSAPELVKAAARLLPKAKVFSGYGLTETSPPNAYPLVDEIESGFLGMKTPPWIEMKIVDHDGREVPKGEMGELVLKNSWYTMDGYYKEPELTKSVMADGYFHTGDLAKIDAQGYFHIIGRLKDMIIVAGLNVYSIEVEDVLHRHPKVLEVAVVGKEDKLRGEVVKAIIALKPGEQADELEIRDFCRQHLSHYKVPHIVEFRESLPKTSSGKIQKELLR